MAQPQSSPKDMPTLTMPTIQAPAVLLIGATGTGKSTSIATLAEAGLDVFIIITEPTGLESIIDTWIAKKLPPDKLHYKVIAPNRIEYDGLIATAKLVGMSDQAAISGMKPSKGRDKAQFHELLKAIANFTDDRTGEVFGPVHSLPANSAFVIDSLSGINIMAMDLVVGDKVTASPGEWGIAMKMIQNLLRVLSSGTKCMFVLTSHMERETDEQTQGTKMMASTLGKKLAPLLPMFFSKVVMAWREQDKFYWSTSTTGVDLKHRSLPLGSKLAPDFKPVYDRYQARVEWNSQLADKVASIETETVKV